MESDYSESSLVSADILLKHLSKRKMGPRFPPPKEVIFFMNSGIDHFFLNFKEVKKHSFLGTKTFIDKNIAVLNPGIGAPSLVLKLEEFAAFGVEKFILLGLSGAIDKNLKIGDIVSCNQAYRDEGCSQHYTDNDEKWCQPDAGYKESIEMRLSDKAIPYKKLNSWSTDAPYRETKEKISECAQRKAHCIEMEASALFTAASFLSVKSCAFFVISDLLYGKEWSPCFDHKVIKNNLNLVYSAISH